MAEVKLYDWNGVLVSADGFRSWLKQTHADLHHLFVELGQKDEANTVEVRRIYEEATNLNLYPLQLMGGARERLTQDYSSGFIRTIFTSIPRHTFNSQLSGLGIQDLVDEVIVLEDIAARFNLPTNIKENPQVFAALLELVSTDLGRPLTYVDDGLKRVEAAVLGNQQFTQQGRLGLERIYHFDLKTQPKNTDKDYIIVNNLNLVN